jgi:hypothetical protein
MQTYFENGKHCLFFSNQMVLSLPDADEYRRKLTFFGGNFGKCTASGDYKGYSGYIFYTNSAEQHRQLCSILFDSGVFDNMKVQNYRKLRDAHDLINILQTGYGQTQVQPLKSEKRIARTLVNVS